jgi:hypothetical protein
MVTAALVVLRGGNDEAVLCPLCGTTTVNTTHVEWHVRCAAVMQVG